MMLRTRVVVTSLLVAVPATALAAFAINRARSGELELAARRVLSSQINSQVRERCESDPTWFFTGPLVGRPPGGVFVPTLDEQLPPRPRPEPQPFELFAYDEAFLGTSPAAPRFPVNLRTAMRVSSAQAAEPYVTDQGTGIQVAMPTGWLGGPCVYFLARMEPPPNQFMWRVLLVTGLFVVFFATALAATTPLVLRIRRLAKDARESVDGGFSAIAPDRLRDELSSLTFVLNDSSQVLHERRGRIDDLDEALRRFVQTTEDEVARPLALLEERIANLTAASQPTRDDLNGALGEAHLLGSEVENLMAATRLRQLPQSPPKTPMDLSEALRRVVARHRPIADSRNVTLNVMMPDEPVVIAAEQVLVERAVANVVDNAVRYNQAGGDVTIRLGIDANDGRFRLTVTDNGPGVSEEQFRGLTAVRRFRGDEGRHRRPGAPGLGLAVVREVCDRYGLTLDLKRPGSGGFEVEISGPL